MSGVTWGQPHSPAERRYCTVRCIGNAERNQQLIREESGKISGKEIVREIKSKEKK
jgi:hypothetical protein